MGGDQALERLLEKLNSGDAQAIEAALRAHEMGLRLIVRRQLSGWLRAKFDSVDVVHSVWVRLLPGLRAGRWQFASTAELRAFLVRATRNRLSTRAQRAALEMGYARARSDADTPPASREPAPAEAAAANELWERLLGLCPAAHREVLRLKREGAPLDRIADLTGLHPSSVRRILYEVMRRVTGKLQANGVEPVSRR
jgi:RNA polymerase sigma-70 factor (ECF subfamily)